MERKGIEDKVKKTLFSMFYYVMENYSGDSIMP